jgi:hypothetical protein
MRWVGIGILAALGGTLGAWTALSVWATPGGDGEGEPDSTSFDSAAGPVSWTHRIGVASGEAHQGPWRMNESDFRYVDAPTVAVDPEGSVAVAWVDQARKDVLFQLYGPDGEARLDEPVNVSRSPRIFSWLPRIVLGPAGSGQVFLLWQEIVFSGGSHGGEIFFSRSTDGGASFGAPLNLSRSPAGAGKGRLTPASWHNGSLDLALGPDGTLYAAWTEYEGALRVSRSTDAGETFGDPVTVARGDEPGRGGGSVPGEAPVHRDGSPVRNGPARGPSLAVGPDGTVHLAWTVGEDPQADIRVARSEDGGRTFAPPLLPAPGSGHADAPKLAVDGEGSVHLVFAERAGGPGGPYRIRYLRAEPGGEGFEAPQTLQGPDPDEGRAGGGFPHLSLDRLGNPYILWERFPEPRGRPVGLVLAASVDGGDSFSRGSMVPGTGDPELGFNGSLQGLLMRKLAVNDRGTLAVVNGTFSPGQESRILLLLGDAPTERGAAVSGTGVSPLPP